MRIFHNARPHYVHTRFEDCTRLSNVALHKGPRTKIVGIQGRNTSNSIVFRP